MKIAAVILSNSTREFDREYHYLLPESLEEGVRPGVRVIVPFGRSNRLVEAYVTELLPMEQEGENGGLKEVAKLIDQMPVLNPDLLNLAKYMKEKYICTFSDAIRCMLPPGIGVKSFKTVKLVKTPGGLTPGDQKIADALLEAGGECDFEELKEKVKGRDLTKRLKSLEAAGFIQVTEVHTAGVREKTIRAAYLARPREEIIDEIEGNRLKRIQQIRVLEILLDNEYVAVSDIIRFSSVSSGVLNTLKKHGYIDFRDIEVSRDPLKHRSFDRTLPLCPTEEQRTVLDTVKEQMEGGGFKEYLLHGVTGSGKTEIYLQLIQRCLEKEKTAIMLVPEISLTPQMVERFKGRFGDDVAVLHSRLSLGERYDQWRLIRDGRIKVAVGARSAVFAPFKNLGIVIVDEEHENTYKSEVTPKYHARDIARERCSQEGAILLCGSATPSVETYFKAKTGRIGLLEMEGRANALVMPGVHVVDMRKELEEGNKTIFSRKLAEEMLANKARGQQTILFLNRRGYASFVLCRQCGFTARCLNCNVSLTYHSFDDRLICHYCGYTVKSPQVCPKCGSTHIRHFGTGTQRVEEEIKKHFPDLSVIRMDMDTTSHKNSHEKILSAFKNDKIDILVGTQMIAKGHDFPNVTLVGVLAADALLNLDDFRASEKTFQLVTQVAGRAGRGEIEGRVVIQTYNTEDFSIQSACRHDYSSFYNQEIKIREKLNYPPFSNIAVLILSGLNDRLVSGRAKELRDALQKAFERLGVPAEVLGPSRAPLSRVKNNFRWRIIIKCSREDIIIKVLETVSGDFYKRKGKSAVELGMDVNPLSML